MAGNAGEGQGCPYMPMVDIHGCAWVCGNIIGAGEAGRRQARPQMGTIGRGLHVGGQETDKKRRFGEEGQGCSEEISPDTQSMF